MQFRRIEQQQVHAPSNLPGSLVDPRSDGWVAVSCAGLWFLSRWERLRWFAVSSVGRF